MARSHRRKVAGMARSHRRKVAGMARPGMWERAMPATVLGSVRDAGITGARAFCQGASISISGKLSKSWCKPADHALRRSFR